MVLVQETAWGKGTEFPSDGSGKAGDGANWGMYIEYPPTTCPTVTSSTSNLVELSGATFPSDVTFGGQTSEDVQYFLEGVTTSHSDIPLNILANNTQELNEDTDIAADTPVCSYYVQFDDGDTTDDDKHDNQSLTFSVAALGAITAGRTNGNDPFSSFDTLCDTDGVLGAASVTYPGDFPATCGSKGDARELELVCNSDRVVFTNGATTVEFDMLIGPKHDSFRIILPAN